MLDKKKKKKKKKKKVLRPRSHYSVFVSVRFCCIEATVHTAPFSYKNGEKNLRFCSFTLICPITKTQRKTSVFVRSHCSVFVKLIVACWRLDYQKPPLLCAHIDQMRFQKPPFLWISTFDSAFENLRFCGGFVRISVNTFTKTEIKNLRSCAFTLIKCVFKNLRFCGYPLLTAFSKTFVFLVVLCGSLLLLLSRVSAVGRHCASSVRKKPPLLPVLHNFLYSGISKAKSNFL